MLPEADSQPVVARRSADIDALFGRIGLSPSTYRRFERRPGEARVLRENSLRNSGLHSLQGGASQPGMLPRSAPEFRRGLARDSCRIGLFSLAGGVGKTTLALSMARICAERSVHCALVNCGHRFALQPLLRNPPPPFGALSFLHAPPGSTGYAVSVINASLSDLEAGNSTHAGSLIRHAATESSVMLIDLPTGHENSARGLLARIDRVLVPLTPDRRSLASIADLETLWTGGGERVRYVFNRFDEHNSLHKELYGSAKSLVGERLLPVSIPEERLIEVAIGQGLTLPDCAPANNASRRLVALCHWLQGECNLESTNFVAMGEALA